MREEVALWFQQAEEDLKTAKLNMEAARLYAKAQFAEQATEKALKALYIHQAAELPPKSHDLKRLGQSVGAPDDTVPEWCLSYRQ